MSFTKTLVPTSPSGINMIAECDIFYPLQTQISDWYLTTEKPPRPPPPPRPAPSPPPPEADYEDNAVQNTPSLPNQQAPYPLQRPPPETAYENSAVQNTPDSPNQQAPYPLQPPPPQPLTYPPPAMNDFSAPADPSGPRPTSGQLDANGVNGQFKFPTDQELGISAGTLINDPNFNVGKHPGEIYVDNGMSMRRRDPTVSNSKNGPDLLYKNQRKKVQSFSMNEGYLWNGINDKDKTAWHPPQPILESTRRRANRLPYDQMRIERNVDQQAANRRRRATEERRDLYEQLESFPMFKNIDPRACILRVICESKHYLLPPGKSLFQDIFRVLFTLPDEESEVDDEFIQAMRSDENECRTVYANKCRYSILGYLLSPERPIL